jgi:hypothetical protein
MATKAIRLAALHLLLCAVLAAGCAKARAEAVPDGPPLAVPEPPARVFVPVDDPLPTAAVTPDPTPTTAPATPPRSAPRRPATANATPDSEASRPAEPSVPPPTAQVPPVQPPALRTQPAAADATAERTVRDTIARATRDINRVDYGRLSVAGREQYEQSKRFSLQAEQALKDRNLPYAVTLADKAATLAAELLGGR